MKWLYNQKLHSLQDNKYYQSDQSQEDEMDKMSSMHVKY
jgi:hypothetical protein